MPNFGSFGRHLGVPPGQYSQAISHCKNPILGYKKAKLSSPGGTPKLTWIAMKFGNSSLLLAKKMKWSLGLG